MGGENATSPGGTNDISFFTIASLGNAQDFGDLTEGRRGPGSCSSSTRGLCGGGFDSPSLKDTIDFVTIAKDGVKELIQVCWDMSNPDTAAREKRALEHAQEELGIEGRIITFNDYLSSV